MHFDLLDYTVAHFSIFDPSTAAKMSNNPTIQCGIERTGAGSCIKAPKLLSIVMAAVMFLVNVANCDVITNNTVGVANLNVSEPANLTQIYSSENDSYFVLPAHVELGDVFHLFANTSAVIKHEGTGFVYSDLKLLPTNQSSSSVTTLVPRKLVEYGYDGWYQSWHQVQVAQQGDWWSPWYPISSCAEFGNSDGGGSISVNWQYTYEWSITVGAGIDWGVASASIEFSISRSVSHGGELVCNANGGGVAQAWYQQHMRWADLQKQDCQRGQANKITCGSWSQYYRVNAPYSGEGAGSRQIGCSTGWGNVRC
ncbi:hypothetical protein HG537_0E00560 [Torulaspora globosa]|uniref:Uncharacterized protein n=1 Tax=Torulaspora globosa TaxID=48254 RepID=A0A7H9HTY8_9SACH|nr:hypothetical protein HG537_0E00560 [Torulaspora sp. CBS 2947]